MSRDPDSPPPEADSRLATERLERAPSPPERRVEFSPGTLVANRFRVVSRVGAGGMGEVYRAEDLRLRQAVALKFITRNRERNPRMMALLHEEVRLGRQISHPNVARLYDIFDWNGLHFVAMEFIDGEDLAALLRRIRRLPRDKAVEIARDLASGLAAAHARGFLHRDLKPANIMIDGRGDAKITDFGLAMMEGEKTGSAGTPAYMAPEQLRGEPATIQSDLYALGLVFYETFTGRRFRGQDAQSSGSTDTSRPPSAEPEMDPATERIIRRCLEEDPVHRPSSAREVIQALPGGDPLAAALAAGQTPSPELVAAAGTETWTPRWATLSLVALIAVLTAAVTIVKTQSSLPALVQWTKPPAVLEEKSTELLKLAGRDPTVPAWSAATDQNLLLWIRSSDPRPGRWERSADLPLVRIRRIPAAGRPLSTSAWNPAIENPAPPDAMEFDPRGNLLRMVISSSATSPANEDTIGVLFAAAGLDPARFHAVQPSGSPPIDVDLRRAWEGTRGERPRLVLHVESGTNNAGRPGWFEVSGPWTHYSSADEIPFATRELSMFLIALVLGVTLIAAVMAFHNARNGRGDRAGAFRIASALALIGALSSYFASAHPLTLDAETALFVFATQSGLFDGAMIFVLYLALEPLVRKLWPELLISWNRLLRWRWRDPLLGRDMLGGLAAGLLHASCASASWLLPAWLGSSPAGRPLAGSVDLLRSFPLGATSLLGLVGASVIQALILGVLLGLGVLLTRRRWAAILGTALVMNLGYYFASGTISLVGFLISALLIGVLVVFGLVGLSAAMFSFHITFGYPLVADPSAWYFPTSVLPLVILAAITWIAARNASDWTGRPQTDPSRRRSSAALSI